MLQAVNLTGYRLIWRTLTVNSFYMHFELFAVMSCCRADKRAQDREDSMGFSVPGRPKKWREKAFKVLEESVSNRLIIRHLYIVHHLTIRR